MTFKEFLTESKKFEENKYYIIEMPNKTNNYNPKLISGPFKTYEQAEKTKPGEYFGINQDNVIIIVKNNKFYIPHHETRKATDNLLSTILGANNKDIEKDIKNK